MNHGRFTILLFSFLFTTLFIPSLRAQTCNNFSINPFPDTTRICGTSASLDAGAGFISYNWNTSETTRTITPLASGFYKVTVSNASGCVASDSTYLSWLNARIINNDTTICKGASVTLNIDSLFPGQSVCQLPSTAVTIATLVTTVVSGITTGTATSGGGIISDGGAPVTVRGVVWSTSSGPTVALPTKTTDGSGIGNFISSLTGLLPNTTYYIRAYATNSAGTAYGNEISFTTPAINPTTTITSLNCAGATNNGTLTSGTAASGVTSVVPYTSGNGGTYAAQTITSTGVTGLTATLTAGTLNNGNGTLTYTITGTPTGSGTASFALSIGGQSCTLTRTVGTASAIINSLNCAGATNNGTLTSGTAASGVTSVVPYTGGNGGTYAAQTITSTGVTGLTATLTAGTLANGAGTLTYTITGTPASSGTASFALSIGGQSCTLTRTVGTASASITSLNCAGATNNGTLTSGTAASGVNSVVPYTGGNGGTYAAQTITSTGVTGLTATLTAGTLANGAGTLTYTITGTPASSGTASFALSIGGQSCTLTRTVGSGGTVNTIRVPVVVHVLTDQPAGVSNISDCIIENQIRILNNTFRSIPGAPNTSPQGTDTEIEFYLARFDPNGNPTNGINRVNTPNCNYTTLNSATQINAITAAAKWPINRYLNIWVLKTMPNSNNVRGQAWTTTSITSLSQHVGVFVHYSYLGSKNSGCPNLSYLDITGFKAYDLGMTLVHEVGHYLDLLHTYGACGTNIDGCDDTPSVSGLPNALCGSNNDTRGVCPGVPQRQWQNYLDYTDDACMDRFTPCQRDRMKARLARPGFSNIVSPTNYNATGGNLATFP